MTRMLRRPLLSSGSGPADPNSTARTRPSMHPYELRWHLPSSYPVLVLPDTGPWLRAHSQSHACACSEPGPEVGPSWARLRPRALAYIKRKRSPSLLRSQRRQRMHQSCSFTFCNENLFALAQRYGRLKEEKAAIDPETSSSGKNNLRACDELLELYFYWPSSYYMAAFFLFIC